MLYYSFILPYFSYCIDVLGEIYTIHTKPLFQLQKKAIRIINKKGSREHTNNLFAESQLLTFSDLVDFKIVLFILNAKMKILPVTIQASFFLVGENNTSRRTFNFKIPFARTTTRHRHVVVYGVKLWNLLDITLKQTTNVEALKKNFKGRILDKYKKEIS